MAFDVYVFLLVVFLLLCVALLGRLCWFQLQPSHSPGGAIRSATQRLLKPRTPLDCPACRLSCAHSTVVGPAPGPVRPWCEVKSRRGAPKRVNTEGYACPNHQCPYFGMTDAHTHAAFWRRQTWPDRTDPDVSRSRLPHHVHCPAPHSPVPSENPLSAGRTGALRAGRRAGSFGCRAGLRLPTSHDHEPFSLAQGNMHRPCTSTASVTSTFRTCSWTSCARGSVAPHRCCGSGWLSTLARKFFPCSLWVPVHNT
jgi:hypothetical protein